MIMPSKSAAQARFMAAVAHNPEFAKKVGVPQSVGEEFASHDMAAGLYQYSRNKKSKK